MNRRELLNGLLSGAGALCTTAVSTPTWAQAKSPPRSGAPRTLRVIDRMIEVKGKAARVYGLAQADGTLGLTFDAGERFDVALVNTIDAPTLVHWHGLTPPWIMDGVPDNPAPLLPPGDARRYSFPLTESGIYWMHAHTLQEQNLLDAPLIIKSAADRQSDAQEIVVILHDFSFTPAAELLAKLKHAAPPRSIAMNRMAHPHMPAMPKMDMSKMDMDFNDVDYDAYLANDRTLDDPQIIRVGKGARVRLRIINAAAATAFTIDTGQIAADLIAVDGHDIAPVAGTTFPLSMAQRVDLRLELPTTGGAFPILALREGAVERTGIILASAGAPIRKLSGRSDQKGPILNLDLERKLRAAAPLSPRAPDRHFILGLTGTMRGYHWGIEGGDALRAKIGERIAITFKNNSMMSHPMHLHGHVFQVIDINGSRFSGAMRDTVLVPPRTHVTIAFDANNAGRWPLHCHNLYHMVTGMMSYVTYEA